MGYNGINFNRARMGPRSGIIDPSRMGPPQVAVPGGSMRQAIVQKSNAPQSVAEILSEGLPEMPGNLGKATSEASRQRQIADMLLQGANSRQATDLVTGFSKLGEAFIARKAGQRADKAEAEAQSVQSLLTQQALGGDRNAQAQLIPIADLLARDQDAAQFDETIGLQRDQFGEEVRQNKFGNELATRVQDYEEFDGDRTFGLSEDTFELDQELGRANVNVSNYNARTGRMTAQSNIAADAAAAEAAAQPEPLFGKETMARVAAGLPNAKNAVAGIRALVFDSPKTNWSEPGYDPASDWGADLIDAVPDWGALKGVARWAGGADYQAFEDRYSTYEAAMLPIMSGAAVTDPEALRQMRAVRIKSGDDAATKKRKIEAMELQMQGMELAARGDMNGFLKLFDEAGELSGAGPVKRGGATPPAAAIDPETEELVNQYSKVTP